MTSPVLQGCLQKFSNLCMLISESWGILAWGMLTILHLLPLIAITVRIMLLPLLICLLTWDLCTIHPEKLILKPTQEIEFLGFSIITISMTVRLSTTKAGKVKCACETLLHSSTHTIQDVTHVIGLTVSSLPATDYGALY